MRKLIAFAGIILISSSLTQKPIVETEVAPALWMRYPVISPDGTSIVFSYKGDLYQVASTGGTAVPMTMSEGHDYMPIFSPDGKSIAFASDRNGNFDIYIMNREGGNAKRLTYHSSNDYPQSFSADGKSIIFASTRLDNAQMIQFPYGALSELYSVPIEEGRETQLSTIAAEDVKFNKAGTKMLFHDKKGYEDPWRKHHTSSVTRDIWLYNKTADSYTQLTNFAGEDRNPIWNSDESAIFYLSEKSGSYNVWKMNETNSTQATQITKFDKNPVRFLSISQTNVLCFGFDGEIYTSTTDGTSKKVNISIQTEDRNTTIKTESFSDGATEMSVSPNGKEVAFIIRGEVFVTSVEGGVTKRITTTAEQERNVSFSPDGRSILYASERDQIWGIYQTNLTRKDELYFFNSTILAEEALIKTTKESFQPTYSPDGKEIAFLEDRTTISIYNIASKKTRIALAGNRNYSYSDGDQYYNWSPDSKYLLVNFLQEGNWRTEIGLLDVTGKEPMIDLTQSGFESYGGRFMMNGKMMLYYTNRNGLKNLGSQGSQSDAYGLFFTQASYDRFKLNKTDYDLLKEKEAKDEKEAPKKDPETKTETKAVKKPIPSLEVEKEGLTDRKVRLTWHSSFLGDAVVTPDGEKMYYFTQFEDGMDLWCTKFKENETKLFLKLNAGGIGSVTLDSLGKTLYCIADGRLIKINLESAEQKSISFNAEMRMDGYAERAYLFEHMWRQVVKKFYVTDLQKTDWAYYKQQYQRFLPHINNNRDFAELMSELLGELNASHTGCRYNARHKNPDETANLGAFFDESFTGTGLKIQEVIAKGPLAKNGTQIKAGVIIEKIDGVEITPQTNHYKLLNRKAGKNMLLALYDPTTKKRWEEIIQPYAPYQMGNLLYNRWVKQMQTITDKLSNGQVGYMHVRGMDDESYREFIDQVMGKYSNKKAIIVDTRFNGGGWLHDDLATFLSGKQYMSFVPREQKIGIEPGNKWTRSSIVLMGEGNYSDAHMFPVAYKALGIGQLVGMPVPGTGTAVWWEPQQDPTLVFGIPEVGVMSNEGQYYENTQLEPDVKVANEYGFMTKGIDQQLQKAIELMMK